MHITRLLPALLIGALAACADTPRLGYPTAAACIHDQFFTALVGDNPLAPAATNGPALFARTLTLCHAGPVPDLTGDTMTQAVAILYKVKFAVNIARDTKIKNTNAERIISTGSMIPAAPMVFSKS